MIVQRMAVQHWNAAWETIDFPFSLVAERNSDIDDRHLPIVWICNISRKNYYQIGSKLKGPYSERTEE